MSTYLDPATFARAIVLEAADIPPGMTIAEWRQQRRAEEAGRARRTPRRGRRGRLRLRPAG